MNMLSTKEILVYATNAVLAIGAFILVWQHVITWPMAEAFILGVVAVPSGIHVGVQRLMQKAGEQ
jgi:hypothetical protein